jgi:phosphoadenosine phosphosulfate reductase
MERLANQAAAKLSGAPAEEVVQWATDTFGDRICITSSMTDAVIIHLASRVREGLDVIFLDTGYHFAETIGHANGRRAGRAAGPQAVQP